MKFHKGLFYCVKFYGHFEPSREAKNKNFLRGFLKGAVISLRPHLG